MDDTEHSDDFLSLSLDPQPQPNALLTLGICIDDGVFGLPCLFAYLPICLLTFSRDSSKVMEVQADEKRRKVLDTTSVLSINLYVITHPD